jgi:hypothetical protein
MKDLKAPPQGDQDKAEVHWLPPLWVDCSLPPDWYSYPTQFESLRSVFASDIVKWAVSDVVLRASAHLEDRVRKAICALILNKKSRNIVHSEWDIKVEIPFVEWMEKLTHLSDSSSDTSKILSSLYSTKLESFGFSSWLNFFDKDGNYLVFIDWSWQIKWYCESGNLGEGNTPRVVLHINGRRHVSSLEIQQVKDRIFSSITITNWD